MKSCAVVPALAFRGHYHGAGKAGPAKRRNLLASLVKRHGGLVGLKTARMRRAATARGRPAWLRAISSAAFDDGRGWRDGRHRNFPSPRTAPLGIAFLGVLSRITQTDVIAGSRFNPGWVGP